MKGRSIVAIAALAAAGTLTFTTSAHAGGSPAQKCASAKQKASGKKESAKLGCYSKAAAKVVPVEQDCLTKAEGSFSAAFTKADPGGVCEGTEATVEFTIDHCVDELNSIITGTGKCAAAKLKAAGKAGAAKASCWAKATGKGLSTDSSNPDPTFTACLQKADGKLVSAFTKADGSAPCAGTEPTVAGTVDSSCIQPVMSQLPPVAPGCGNGILDAGETCDDGNTVNGDSCPSSCVIQSCTVDTTAHQGISLLLTTPAGVTVGGLTLFLDYPEGKVRLPVTTPGASVLDTPNDLTYALKDPLIDSTFIDGIPANGAGPMLQVTFDRCQGQALPVVGDYNCTILDASDENGNSIDISTLNCTVNIIP